MGTPPPGGGASPSNETIGLPFAAWFLGFAAVNVWQLPAGRPSDEELRGHATVLALASVLVLLLKLVGAGVALASLRSMPHGRVGWLLGRD